MTSNKFTTKKSNFGTPEVCKVPPKVLPPPPPPPPPPHPDSPPPPVYLTDYSYHNHKFELTAPTKYAEYSGDAGAPPNRFKLYCTWETDDSLTNNHLDHLDNGYVSGQVTFYDEPGWPPLAHLDPSGYSGDIYYAVVTVSTDPL